MTFDEWKALDSIDADYYSEWDNFTDIWEAEDLQEEFSLWTARGRITRVKDRERENQ